MDALAMGGSSADASYVVPRHAVCLFAVLLALIGAVLGPIVPYDFGTKIGAKSVDNVLNVLASSMLAVTTFSLTAMVQAYSGATSNITPRAVQLLIDDTTARNALSTFLGSFLFAVVGIIALSTDLYGETGRIILYLGTILVILFIVVTLLRWIEHIARFGRVPDTIRRVENAAMKAVVELALPPCFGSAHQSTSRQTQSTSGAIRSGESRISTSPTSPRWPNGWMPTFT